METDWLVKRGNSEKDDNSFVSLYETNMVSGCL